MEGRAPRARAPMGVPYWGHPRNLWVPALVGRNPTAFSGAQRVDLDCPNCHYNNFFCLTLPEDSHTVAAYEETLSCNH